MPLLICPDCGEVINDAHYAQIRCPDCADKWTRHQYALKGQEKWAVEKGRAEYIPIRPKVCEDCGIAFIPENRNPYFKRCPECRKVIEGRYFAIRDIRKNFHDLAAIDPCEAERIEVQMREEEGDEFTKMALDGIPDRMHSGLLQPKPPRGKGGVPFGRLSIHKKRKDEAIRRRGEKPDH